jgi:hypothetical protein
LFINLTPFVPLSILGEGEKKKEGLTPLLDAPKVRELKRGEYRVPTKTRFLWGKKPLLIKYFPPSLTKGRGSGGWVTK